MAEYPTYRHTRAAIAEEVKNDPNFAVSRQFESDPMEIISQDAAKEVDQERREVDGVMERMRSRQAYFYEKAQMHREAADFYQRMSEDLADLLNNDFVNRQKEST